MTKTAIQQRPGNIIAPQKFGKRPYTEFERRRYCDMLDQAFGPGFAQRNPMYVTAYLQRRQRRTDGGDMAESIDMMRRHFAEPARC